MRTANVSANHDESRYDHEWRHNDKDIVVRHTAPGDRSKPEVPMEKGTHTVEIDGSDADSVYSSSEHAVTIQTEDDAIKFALALVDSVQAVVQLHDHAKNDLNELFRDDIVERSRVAINTEKIDHPNMTGVTILTPFQGRGKLPQLEYIRAYLRDALSNHNMEPELNTRFDVTAPGYMDPDDFDQSTLTKMRKRASMNEMDL